MDFVLVGFGGALGAMARYGISTLPVKSDFPILTLITNLIGAILIGFIAGLAAGDRETAPHAVLFWKAGLCGGFTTFSTFSLEAFELLENRRFLAGSAYIVLSVAGCLAGIYLGRRLAAMMP